MDSLYIGCRHLVRFQRMQCAGQQLIRDERIDFADDNGVAKWVTRDSGVETFNRHRASVRP
jgi:hypothetical protein